MIFLNGGGNLNCGSMDIFVKNTKRGANLVTNRGIHSVVRCDFAKTIIALYFNFVITYAGMVSCIMGRFDWFWAGTFLKMLGCIGPAQNWFFLCFCPIFKLLG